MVPGILIFSIAIGVDYSYEVKNSEIWAPTFFKHNNSFIATVIRHGNCLFPLIGVIVAVTVSVIMDNTTSNSYEGSYS